MPQSLFAACRIDDTLVAKRVRLGNDERRDVENTFNEQARKFREGVENEVEYDGGWKPDEGEVLTMAVPDKAELFVNAVQRNPISVDNINENDFKVGNVKALFMGVSLNGNVAVCIQRFISSQVLSRKFSLFLSGEMFRRLRQPVFALNTSLTCIIEHDRLKFKSFQNLKSILNMSDIYRTATESEVREFAEHSKIHVANANNFIETADQTCRKLIYTIKRRGTLDQYDANSIRESAYTVGIEIKVISEKIHMPQDRADIKKVLRFLDDAIYKSDLTQTTYMTNSKKKI